MITIRLTLEGNVDRWAQNRSATFDNSFTVCKQEDAKQFSTVHDSYKWLVQHGFMRRVTSKYFKTRYVVKDIPAPFISWELEGVTRETPVS